MTLTRWDPIRDLMSIQERLNRVFNDRTGEWSDNDVYGNWAPPVDIFENGDDLVLHAELPGVSRDAIDVRVEDGTLMLEGERKRANEITDQEAYRLERSYGRFSRSFRLPTTVDTSKISARYKDGVLEVRLPKIEAAKPRKVEIHAA